MNLAIVIGITDYVNCDNLTACTNDVQTMSSIIKKLNKFNEICEISSSCNAKDAKLKISEFVKKHKNNDIEELFFYFSGHGARYEDDFFYLFSDFSESQKETTAFRNTELDGLIRAISPELTIKIVDACYSGNFYIKNIQSDNDLKPVLKSSATENLLKNIYFLYSSSASSESLAMEDYSIFTKQIFESITKDKGKLRYNDIIAYTADTMESSGYPQPVFVTQANHTELFGNITDDLISFIHSELKLDGASIINEDTPVINDNKNEFKLIDLVVEKSKNEYCSKEEAFESINIIENKFSSSISDWSKQLTNLFDISFEYTEGKIPNSVDIARWLERNKEGKYFATPTYKVQTYYEQEYVKLPRNPLGRFHSLLPLSQDNLYDAAGNEYKLTDVKKHKEYINDFTHTAPLPFNCVHIMFHPLHQSLKTYCLTIVPICSHNKLELFKSLETLDYIDWDKVDAPQCKQWEHFSFLLKDKKTINEFCSHQILECVEYLIQDIQATLKTS